MTRAKTIALKAARRTTSLTCVALVLAAAGCLPAGHHQTESEETRTLPTVGTQKAR